MFCEQRYFSHNNVRLQKRKRGKKDCLLSFATVTQRQAPAVSSTTYADAALPCPGSANVNSHCNIMIDCSHWPSVTVVITALAFFCSRASISTAEENTNKCKLYLAKSTIPNAGLGVFTGVDLSTNETIG